MGYFIFTLFDSILYTGFIIVHATESNHRIEEKKIKERERERERETRDERETREREREREMRAWKNGDRMWLQYVSPFLSLHLSHK